MLLFASALCLLMGVFVASFGQEPKIRGQFLLMCLSCAALTTGLWVELNYEEYAFLAARCNMTFGVILGLFGCTAGLVMCGARWHRLPLGLLVFLAAFNVISVWATDIYFTGEYVSYGWGGYVVAHPYFAFNPALLGLVAIYTIVSLILSYPRAHPLDRNRIPYIVLSWVIITLAALDYLPHFGIDLFGGPVSAVCVPLFAATFGYALLRFRLLDFRAAVLRSTSWLITMFVVAIVYAVILEASNRWTYLGIHGAHIAAAAAGLAAFGIVGRAVPGWLRNLAGADEENYQRIVDAFSDGLRAVDDESAMRIQLEAVFRARLDSSSVTVVDQAQLMRSPEVTDALKEESLVECEVLRRRGVESELIESAEIIVPLQHGNNSFGALMLGGRNDGSLYPRRSLDAIRTIANVFSVAVTNARSSVELHQRHQLDRFMAPQIVEHALQGEATGLHARRRQHVTTFFSDLKGFTALSDRLDPDVMSTVLNEYLTAMTEAALEHGGTVDKFIGDAVMVLFGCPNEQPSPSQVRSALRMGTDMYNRLETLNASWRERNLLDNSLECRMGIHSGEATVGSFGSHLRADYTAIGRAVNLASRLETACQPGCMLLSASSWELVSTLLPDCVESRSAITVKGFSEAIEVVQIDPVLLGPVATPSPP